MDNVRRISDIHVCPQVRESYRRVWGHETVLQTEKEKRVIYGGAMPKMAPPMTFAEILEHHQTPCIIDLVDSECRALTFSLLV